MGGEIDECNGMDTFGYDRAAWSEALKRIGEAHGIVCDEFGEDVCSKYLRERAQAQQRVLGGKLMRVGRGLAVSLEKDLIVANDDENHSGGAGLKEQICAERASRFEVGERWRERRLREGRREGEHEEVGKQCDQEFCVTHFVLRLQSTKPSDFPKTEMQYFGHVSLDRYSQTGIQSH